MAKGASVSFTLSCDGIENRSEKQFELKPGCSIRIGRSPVADYHIDNRGISQQHCEIRLAANGSGLVVRDSSSNGTGLKRPGTTEATPIKKETDEQISDGSTILVPMRVKPGQGNRAWLTVTVQNKQGGGGGNDDQEDSEEKRKAFVQLLLQAKEISDTTTYKEATKLLSHDKAWKACDDEMREECFTIFVDHLGDAAAKKKDKKKGKKKDKENGEEKEKKRKISPPSGSPAGRGRNSKRAKGGRGRSGSRGGGSPVANRSRSRQVHKSSRRRRVRSRSD